MDEIKVLINSRFNPLFSCIEIGSLVNFCCFVNTIWQEYFEHCFIVASRWFRFANWIHILNGKITTASNQYQTMIFHTELGGKSPASFAFTDFTSLLKHDPRVRLRPHHEQTDASVSVVGKAFIVDKCVAVKCIEYIYIYVHVKCFHFHMWIWEWMRKHNLSAGRPHRNTKLITFRKPSGLCVLLSNALHKARHDKVRIAAYIYINSTSFCLVYSIFELM